MTVARVLCVNNSGAKDRLTQGVVYRVVGEFRGLVVVIDDRGERTAFAVARFTPLPIGTRKEVRVRT